MNSRVALLSLCYLTISIISGETQSKLEVEKNEINTIFQVSCRNSLYFIQEDFKLLFDYEKLTNEFNKYSSSYGKQIVRNISFVQDSMYVYPIYVSRIEMDINLKIGFVGKKFLLTAEIKGENYL